MIDYAKYAPISQGVMRIFVAYHIRRGFLVVSATQADIKSALDRGVVCDEICRDMMLRGHQVVKSTAYELAGDKYTASITVWEYCGIDKT